MDRRGLFKGFAALVGVAAMPAAVARPLLMTGENGPELHIESANSGVIRAGSIRSVDGSFLIDFDQHRIYIST